MVGIKKIFCLTLLLGLTSSTCLWAFNVHGHVMTKKGPLSDVVVTDGLHFSYTRSDGYYELDAPSDAKFVYLLTPKGYVADYSKGVPQFFQSIHPGKSQYDFVLYPMKGDANKTLMIASADPQIDTDSDVTRFFNETLPDMQSVISEYPDCQKAMFMAGDLTWDVYGRNSQIKEFARKLNIPLYPVIGNHDYDKYMTPSATANYAHTYEDNFGPTYYAFQLGDNYYVVLNDIKYTGNKHYTLSLNQGHQMEWLKGLLGMVLQQDKTVFVIAHAPICQPGGTHLIDGGAELRSMLADKPFRAAIFSGHIHNNSVTNIGNDIWEYNLGAICGYWWTNNYSGDGTPNGYKVILTDKRQWQQVYKSTGKPLSCQMDVYVPGRIADRPDDVCCKVWNWDYRWQIRWYADGVFQGNMEQFYSFAPEYLCYLNGRLTTADYFPVRTNHFFSCHPDKSVREVKIEAVDPYGNIYSKTISLH